MITNANQIARSSCRGVVARSSCQGIRIVAWWFAEKTLVVTGGLGGGVCGDEERLFGEPWETDGTRRWSADRVRKIEQS